MSGKKKAETGNGKKVTRYTYNDVKEPRSPETGHTSLLPTDELTVTLPMDNGWGKKLQIGRIPDEDERPIIVDMDPDQDPVLLWSGKRNRREIPVLPLQKNEIVSESRIAQIIERAKKAAAEKSGTARQGILFDLEKTLRESDKAQRVEFYKHEEGWKNKLICGDSLQVMESLMHYEGLRGKVQMIYMDPPYGINYDSNFQQRVDSYKNDDKDQADDILTIKAFRDTWVLGVHSYLSYLQERLYLCRECLSDNGVIFLQIGEDTCHDVRILMDEVFGARNYIRQIVFRKTGGKSSGLLDSTYDVILWYARNLEGFKGKYRQVYVERNELLEDQYRWLERPDGSVLQLTEDQLSGRSSIPEGRRFLDDNLTSQGESADAFSVTFKGRTYPCPAGRHWSTGKEGIERLAELGRLVPVGNWLKYKRYLNDMPVRPVTDQWLDTVMSTFSREKIYAVQTPLKVLDRCILLSTDPGDLVFDPTCGSGTSAFSAERLGRRWITCDTSRVAINKTRQRLLSAVFEHFRTRNGRVSGNFIYKPVKRVTLKSLAYDLEPEEVELVDQPDVDRDAIRVCGPFEVMSIGRYSIEDWKGYVNEGGGLADYIEVICRLYRKDAAFQGSSGLVHAIAESEKDRIAISVGPVVGRVTGKQINDAVQDALASGILEVHVLGWAFEANVGEIKSQLEGRGKVKVELVMIRPDTLAEGLKATKPEMLFSPLGIPGLKVDVKKGKTGSEATVALEGLAIFDRTDRSTQWHAAESGYISAWYLDEDYDGDCFVDSQMFFDFKKAPNLQAALKAEIDPAEYKLQTTSRPFPVRGYKRVAVKVVDVFGNESTVVKDLG